MDFVIPNVFGGQTGDRDWSIRSCMCHEAERIFTIHTYYIPRRGSKNPDLSHPHPVAECSFLLDDICLGTPGLCNDMHFTLQTDIQRQQQALSKGGGMELEKIEYCF